MQNLLHFQLRVMPMLDDGGKSEAHQDSYSHQSSFSDGLSDKHVDNDSIPRQH